MVIDSFQVTAVMIMDRNLLMTMVKINLPICPVGAFHARIIETIHH